MTSSGPPEGNRLRGRREPVDLHPGLSLPRAQLPDDSPVSEEHGGFPDGGHVLGQSGGCHVVAEDLPGRNPPGGNCERPRDPSGPVDRRFRGKLRDPDCGRGALRRQVQRRSPTSARVRRGRIYIPGGYQPFGVLVADRSRGNHPWCLLGMAQTGRKRVTPDGSVTVRHDRGAPRYRPLPGWSIAI